MVAEDGTWLDFVVRPRLIAAAVVLACVVGASGGLPYSALLAAEVRTLQGDREVEITAGHWEGERLVFETPEGSIDAATVREIVFTEGLQEALASVPRLFLRNGDEISARLIEGTDEHVTIAGEVVGRVRVPLDLISAVAFTSDQASLARIREEVLPKDPESDFVVLRSWGQKTGVLESIGPDGVTIELEGVGSVTLGKDKLLAVRLAPLAPLAPTGSGLIAKLDLASGSKITGRLSSIRDGVAYVDVAFAERLEVSLSRVRALRFLGGAFTYLSDLKAAEAEERSDVIGLVFEHRRDAAVMGGPLRLGGRVYRKGIGAKAYTRLAFDLDKRYQSFRAVIGLDDTARARRDVEGTVVFQVLVDGKKALGKSGLLLTSNDAPRPLEIEVKGAKRIELICDFGPSSDVLARAAWADAHLVR